MCIRAVCVCVIKFNIGIVLHDMIINIEVIRITISSSILWLFTYFSASACFTFTIPVLVMASLLAKMIL